jgi:Skp family chaperone for outer membrane proteins
VKQTYLTMLAGLCLAFGFVSQAAAQGLPQFVAVVDVAQLIKNHPDFRVKQEALQKTVQAEEAKFRSKQEQIVAKEKALSSSALNPGTPEHQKQMDEIADEYADFEKEAKTMQRKFALENSKIMYETYKDIKQSIGKFAKARKIAQVTDFRVFEPNPLEPQSVAEDMDQKLVWFDETLNITDLIISQLYADRGLQRPAADAAAPKTAAAPLPAGTAQQQR